MTKTIEIDGRKIGASYVPYVIAEMSANHNGSIETAFNIIREAKKAGADAVKIQTYTPDTITIDCDREDFRIEDGLWAGRTLHQLYDWAHTPWSWHADLFKYANEIGITLFSSPFDMTAIDLLESLGAPAYKIASFEAVDHALIKYAASTGKPMIISTGMADAEEIQEAVQAAHDGGCKELALLHCVSGYPAPASDYNLRTINDMARRYGHVIGLSDHTLDNTTAIVSVAMGASIIEKHFTLDRKGGGPDDSFSLEPSEMATLCRDAKTAWNALGNVDYGRKSSELGNIKFRRSLYVVKDMKAGDVVSFENVRSIRPGFGLAPKHLEAVLGKCVKEDIVAGTPLKWSLVSF